MDPRFSTLLIDEPELGLSPRVQGAFANFLQSPEYRRKYFPHLANVYLATHSHIFLDRTNPKNNFIVAREEQRLWVSQVNSVSELHQLQFNLLGNELETMFLPSAIVIVEGKTDLKYLERVIELKHPNRRITVLSGQGDVKSRAYAIREILGGDLQKSPFRDRLFVVLDSVHQPSLRQELTALGIPDDHVVEWSRNGIEYLYPTSLLADKYACPPGQVNDLRISGDVVSLGTLAYKKSELCDEIVMRLTLETELPAELEERLLAPLALAIL
jgi:hypothetical protein